MFAKPDQFDEVYGILMQYKEIFTYLRQDQVKRRIEAGEIYFSDGVVIVFCKYKVKVKMGGCQAVKGDCVIHQIANKEKRNGMAVKIAMEFIRDIVGTADLWATLKASNVESIRFHNKIGLEEVGNIEWAGGKIKGLVFRRDGLYHSIVGDDYVETNQGVQV